MILTVEQRARIQWLVDYLSASGGGYGRLNQKIADELARIFGPECGFRCGCPGTFREGLRDAPTLTLLRVLLCGEEGTCVPSAGDTITLPDGEVIVVPPAGSSGPPAPDMLTTCSYGVLAATTITNTGPTFITGDLGLFPGSSVTGAPTVSGTSNIANAAAQQAQVDLIAIYNDLAGRPPDAVVAGNIGGQTLTPGVYKSTSSLAVSSGDLILDGQGNVNSVFIFQIASTLTLTSGRNIILINGAQAKNVFWQVGSSATLGSGSSFKGSIVGLTSTTLVIGGTVEGRILMREAAITMDTNVVTSPGC